MTTQKTTQKRNICTQINVYDVDIDDPMVLVCPACHSGNQFDIECTATFRYQFDKIDGSEDEPGNRWAGKEAHLDNKTYTICLDCGHEGQLFDFAFIVKKQ